MRHLLKRDRGDPRPLVGHGNDEALALELNQRGVQRRPADAELFADLNFGEWLTWRKHQGDDGFLDTFVGQVFQRGQSMVVGWPGRQPSIRERVLYSSLHSASQSSRA